MQGSKQEKEEKSTSNNHDLQFLESKRLDAVRRNFAIGIDRTGFSQNVQEGPTRIKNLSKN